MWRRSYSKLQGMPCLLGNKTEHTILRQHNRTNREHHNFMGISYMDPYWKRNEIHWVQRCQHRMQENLENMRRRKKSGDDNSLDRSLKYALSNSGSRKLDGSSIKGYVCFLYQNICSISCQNTHFSVILTFKILEFELKWEFWPTITFSVIMSFPPNLADFTDNYWKLW